MMNNCGAASRLFIKAAPVLNGISLPAAYHSKFLIPNSSLLQVHPVHRYQCNVFSSVVPDADLIKADPFPVFEQAAFAVDRIAGKGV